MVDVTEPRTSAATRQALRERYFQRPHETPPCLTCGAPMTVGEPERVRAGVAWDWRCPNDPSHRTLRHIDHYSDLDVIAAVADADALAGALAEVERLRASLAFYADPHTYLAHGSEPFSQSAYIEPEIEHDRGARARVTLGRPADLRAALATSGTPAGIAHNRTLGGQGGVLGSATANGDAGATGRADGENAADGWARGLASGEDAAMHRERKEHTI